MGLFDRLFGREEKKYQPTLQNEEQYQQGLDTMSGAYNQHNEYMQGLMGEAAGHRGQGAGFLQQYMNQDPARFQLDPMAAQNAFLGGAPELQQLARSSVSDYAPDDFLRMERENILSQLGDSFGGNPNSGAFMGAASQAIATPLLQRAQAQEQMRSNLTGQLLGQSQGLLNQNFLQDAQGRYGAQLQDQQRYLNAAQGYSGLGGQALQGAGIHAGLAGQGLSGLASLTQPVYSTPTIHTQPSPWDRFMGVANDVTGLASNIASLAGGGE